MSGVRYSIIPAAAVVDERVSDLHLRILAIFGKASDANGWLRANQTALARQMGRARETINRAIADLVEWGYLRKQARYSGSDGRQLINDYQVVMDRPHPQEEEASEPVKPAPPCDPQITPPCDVQITGGVTSRDHTIDTTPFLHLPMKRGPRSQKAPACRLPEDFEPDLDWAVKAGMPADVARRERDKFRDYWRARAGKDALKADWPATWRNWIRRSLESPPGRQAKPPPGRDNLADYLNRNFAPMENFHDSDFPAGPTIDASPARGSGHGSQASLQLAAPDRGKRH